MDYFAESINTANLHHLYLIEGDGEIMQNLALYLKKRGGFDFSNNPDITIETFETFGVEESRLLKRRHAESSFGSKRFFIMHVLVFGAEAEQALLKVFEEPNPDTHFFVVVSSLGAIAETIKSRGQLLFLKDKNTSKAKEESFLSKNLPERLGVVKDFIVSYKNDETTGRLRHDAIEFLSNIEILLHKKWKDIGRKEDWSLAFNDLNKMRDFLNDRGTPVKMILEHIAVTMPVI